MNDASQIAPPVREGLTDTSFGTAAYGGEGWSPRTATHAEEFGRLWAGGLDSEWRELKTVLLRRPEAEIAVNDTNAAQQLAPIDAGLAGAQYDAMADAYRAAGVEVLEVADVAVPTPNRMFCADLFAMTPAGAILARPASTVRAGEEVAVAAALSQARVPILRTLTGTATFEGADLIWMDEQSALLAQGLRTNAEAARQIGETLAGIGVEMIPVDLPFGTMHLMGMLRIPDKDLVIAWPHRTPLRAVTELRKRGYRVEFQADLDEISVKRGNNFVTLGPGRILMPGDNPRTRAWYESLGIEVIETPVTELRKAAGAVGCMTGVVEREMA